MKRTLSNETTALTKKVKFAPEKGIFLQLDEIRSLLDRAQLKIPELETFDACLPRILHLGAQCSCKSSCASSLTGIPLACGDGMTTRFKMELQFRSGEPRPPSYRFLDGNGNLVQEGPYDVNVIQNSQTAVEKAGKVIFRDRLIITQYGLEHDNLSYIDLPGLIQAQNQEEQALANEIYDLTVEECHRPNTYRLEFIDVVADLGSCMSSFIINQCDPQRKHTIIVFTRVDLIPFLSPEKIASIRAHVKGGKFAFLINKVFDADGEHPTTEEEEIELLKTKLVGLPEALQGRRALKNFILARYTEMVKENLPLLEKEGRKALQRCQDYVKILGPRKNNEMVNFADLRTKVLSCYSAPGSIPYETRLRNSREPVAQLFEKTFPLEIDLEELGREMDNRRGNTVRPLMGQEDIIKVYLGRVVQYYRDLYLQLLNVYKESHRQTLKDILTQDQAEPSQAGAKILLQRFITTFEKLWTNFLEQMIQQLEVMALEIRIAHVDCMNEAVSNHRLGFSIKVKQEISKLKQCLNMKDVQQIQQILSSLEAVAQENIDRQKQRADDVEETRIKIRACWEVTCHSLQTIINNNCCNFELQVKQDLKQFLDQQTDFSLFAEAPEITDRRNFILDMVDRLSHLIDLICQSRA